jgi:ABC-2 type transport system ATP-binding protein
VVEPTEGAAAIGGHDIRREPLAAREHLGIVPEQANVYLDLSVWRNVMLMAELHAVPRATRAKEGERLLDLLGLADRKTQKARALSKGLRQRLMLCSALVSGPQILFLDEPTSGLDVQSARLIRRIVRELNRDGLTVFLTTHNMAEAEEICGRVAIINKGRIAAIDTPDQLRDALKSSQYVSVRFEKDGASVEQLAALPGVESTAEDEGGFRLYCRRPGQLVSDVLRLAESSGLTIAEIATCKPTLEDVFVHLTGAETKEGRP